MKAVRHKAGLYCLIRLRVGEGPLLGKALGFVQSGGINMPGVGRRSLLQARTSPLEVDILPDTGKVIARRADFLIGGAGRGVACVARACAFACGGLHVPSLAMPAVWVDLEGVQKLVWLTCCGALERCLRRHLLGACHSCPV